MAYDLSAVPSASTVQFELTATKDGAIWNLTGGTVSLVLIAPDDTVQTKTASLTDAANGVAAYTASVSDIVEVGIWRRYWRVVSGSIDIKSETQVFRVY